MMETNNRCVGRRVLGRGVFTRVRKLGRASNKGVHSKIDLLSQVVFT